jgi:DNA-binding transcriptional ArsR family regulator
MLCPSCGAQQYSKSARFCTKCGSSIPARTEDNPGQDRLGRFLRALFRGSGPVASAIIRPRVGRRAPVGYTWRSRRGVLRATRTDGTERRGQPRPEIFGVPGLSTSAKKVYYYLSRVSDVDGYAFPFVRTIAARTHLSKTTVEHALQELEGAELVTRTHRYSKRGSSSNVYRLSPPSE